MKLTTLLLLCVLIPGWALSDVTPTPHPAAPVLPPEIQKAQNAVWDLQFQLYQAQHDLALAQIDQKEAELTAQKNANQGLTGQYTEFISKLELNRSQIENRYSLAQQWYNAVQSGDLDGAKSIQQQMNQPQ